MTEQETRTLSTLVDLLAMPPDALVSHLRKLREGVDFRFERAPLQFESHSSMVGVTCTPRRFLCVRPKVVKHVGETTLGYRVGHRETGLLVSSRVFPKARTAETLVVALENLEVEWKQPEFIPYEVCSLIQKVINRVHLLDLRP